LKKVHFLVEGQTEESFIKQVIQPHLSPRGLWANPVIVTTKRTKKGPDFKGGITSYSHVKKDIRRLLGDSSATMVTTLMDFYGLPDSFPGRSEVSGTPQAKAAFVEQAFGDDIANQKFLPYLSLHEFEALLFTSPFEIARALNDRSKEEHFAAIRRDFPTPEDINDNPPTIPSRRIMDHFPRYNKGYFGAIIAVRIGLQRIREQCPHFASWISRLEKT
jgi:hypothetical protein